MHKPFDVYRTLSIRTQLLLQAHTMANYALASGINVPASVAQTLDAFAPQTEAARSQYYQMLAQANPDQPLATGTEGAPPMTEADVRRLAMAHDQLIRIVAPSTPRSLLFLESRSAPTRFRMILSPIPIVRRMVWLALVSLALFILMSVTHAVSADVNAGDILTSFGLNLFYNEILYLAAAGIGASFAALFKMNRYLTTCTFDPKFEPSYWIRFALGLVAGIILALLIPIEDANLRGLAKPTLALLGGFSSSAVYRILMRLIETIESLVKGETRDLLATHELAAKAAAAEGLIQSRLQLAAGLVALQKKLGTGNDAAVQQQLDRMLDGLLPPGDLGHAPPTGDGTAASTATPVIAPPPAAG